MPHSLSMLVRKAYYLYCVSKRERRECRSYCSTLGVLEIRGQTDRQTDRPTDTSCKLTAWCVLQNGCLDRVACGSVQPSSLTCDSPRLLAHTPLPFLISTLKSISVPNVPIFCLQRAQLLCNQCCLPALPTSFKSCYFLLLLFRKLLRVNVTALTHVCLSVVR